GFLLAWLLPAGHRSGHARFDVLGGVLMVAATGFLLLGLDEIQDAGPLLLPFLALAVLAGWGFIRVQRRRADPLIALRHFANPGLSLALASATLLNLATFAILLLGPFLLARATSLSPMASGAMLAAAPLGMMIAAPLAGRLAAAIGTRRLGRIGLAVTSLGLGGLGLVASPLDIALVAAAMFVQGIGQGLFQVANFDIVTSALPATDRGVAGSLAMLTRTLGLMLGATLLMLASVTFTRWAAVSLPVEDAFIAGIGWTFRLAAAVALALLVLDLAVRTSRR
ncbi:MAG: MFS transporter, partial [Alphaproteobacteria bacterium]|nr:MFS transporter [Alphaproteobacteria bacterium]